jgi:hypothetical protein
MSTIRLLIAAAVVAAAGLSSAVASRQPSPVTLVELPLKLPAVGNLPAVKQWRFGRLEQVEQFSGQPDIILSIRTMDDAVLRIAAPAAPLVELARRSNWVDPGKARPGRSDYVERMIAFDVDAQSRLIAMMSLEPMGRSDSRLRRALSP